MSYAVSPKNSANPTAAQPTPTYPINAITQIIILYIHILPINENAFIK